MLPPDSRMKKDSCRVDDEIENVPLNNPNHIHHIHHLTSTSHPPDSSSSRAPFHSIPDDATSKPLFINNNNNKTPVKSSRKVRFGYDSTSLPHSASTSTSTSTRNHSFNLTPRLTTKTASTTYSDTTSTLNTPTKSVTKPPNPAYLYSNSRHATATATATSRPSSFSSALSRPSLVNTLDVPHFDLKEDPSFWMDHNVQVIIRVRPLNGNERNLYGYNRCVRQESAHCIAWIGHPETRFTFDHVACETVDQEMLFRMAALPMVENCLSGYNSCMFAYGQTGSGKTYTMLGEMEDDEFTPSPHRGMTPRIFEFLFARIRAEEESRRDEKLKYSCKCSFLEIYNEQITDLLDPSSTNLLLREDVKKGVYVENLSEFEVHTVGDVLGLLIQGSSNRKVAATNMNRESSRSHCVFIFIIESKWERDSVTNYRFARLNLVDLAGSERQKSSGAEGERLKEAANINKSLSTLGHVIMLLVDIAHGKPRHIPYRDSRLTFLLQDSLGGNSKTMIIANVSPSVCCAAETLNTLKFAQRAKLIQNNAVVNEDSSGDIAVLQHQIWLLQEELSALKHQNVSRTLAFDPSQVHSEQGSRSVKDQVNAEDSFESESKGGVRVSPKQLKTLEMMLAGALRREQMSEASMKQLESEIEQLNRLVRQREEDTRCTKMMLKFREDKIQRMESLLGKVKPVDAYLLEENAALSEEIQMLQAKVDRNPEVTRFAVENIRLLEELRRFQDFYEEGERDLLMNEVSELRAQLIRFHDDSMQQHMVSNTAQDAANDRKENESLTSKLTSTANELAECQTKLKACLETNSKLSREIEVLHDQLRNKDLELNGCHDILDAMKVQVPLVPSQASERVVDENITAEEVVNLELEVDILKIILKEEKLSRCEMEELASSLTKDVQKAEQQVFCISKQCRDVEADLLEAKSVIQALESQQLLSITEIEDLKKRNGHHLELLCNQELQISALKEQASRHESSSCLKLSECEDLPLQEHLKRMQASLDKAKRLNTWYQSDHAYQRSNEEEMDQIRRQAEAETAEVIVCLQEELSVLQERVNESDSREKEAENRSLILETKLKELHEDFNRLSSDNQVLCQNLLEKELQIKSLTDDWEQLSCEIEEALIEGHEALRSASNELSNASTSYPRGLVSAQVGKMIRQISDKESLIQELNTCLEKANIKTVDMEHMLMSLKGATIVMSEAHQQEFCEKENEILKLRSELQASLSAKKEGIYLSEMNDLETIQAVEVGVLSLQAAFVDFEKQCQSKFQTLSPKLNKLEENAKEAKCSWRHMKELLEYELVDSKAAEAQKAEEASCLLVQFEEVQETMKEADMMINGLMIANETMKLEIEDCKNMNIMLNGEVERLVNEVQTLQSANELKDQKCSYLEKEVALNALETVGLLEELQGLVSSVKDASEKAVISLTHDFSCFKSHLQETMNLMHSSLEDIWSEIVSRDCTVSVLHLCHIDMLSEVATLIKSEKSLQHDICESETLINSLREQNMKSKQELEICRLVKDRLLSDIELSFNRISSNEGETRELHMKLDRFKENLAALQCQEELMLETCNLMGSKLTMLEKDSNQSNSTVAAALVEHDMLQEYNTKLIEQNCCTTLDSAVTEIVTSSIFADLREHLLLEKESAKDLEVSFVKSELQQLSQHNFYMDKQQQICCTALDSLVAEIVTQKMFADLREQLLFEKESEVDHLQATLGMAQDNLAVLQRREELLGSKLALLEEELNLSKSTVGASLVEQDKLQKTNTKLIESQAEVFSMELYAKDLEVSFVTSELQQLAQHNSYMDRQQQIFCTALDSLVSEIVTQKMFADLREQLLSEKESEVDNMHTTIKKAQDSESRVLIELQALGTLSSNKVAECADSVEIAELQSCRIFSKLQQNIMLVMDQISVDSCQNIQSVSKFLEELGHIDNMANDILSQNLFLKQMLLRKDEVLNGLLFDLRLLQESAANSKDQQNQIEEIVVALDSTECALDTKSRELDEAITFGKVLEAKVKEQGDVILATKMDLENANQSLKILFDENEELKSQVKDISAARISVEKELCEKRSAIDSLENELLEMGNTLGQMNDLVESLKNTLDDVNGEKDRLQKELMILEAKLETAHALARENEAIAVEAQQIAESRRLYAEEKEEEVQLLERSVQELDSTITVLENKVDALKGETERQRFQREELELELHTFKNQMQSVEFADSEVKRQLDEKTRNLQEALTLIDVLEKGLAHRDTEVAKCKTHISELSLHAEAQACEYKQKFNELEATLEHFRAEAASNHEQNASCNKLEKNPPKARGSASPFKAKGSSSPFKGRGSGSPFKCIGLGLAHQLKSEKDEEINAEKLRIEELESLAATRQKEIFVLNARLAATESMTHDVIRDLLGVKLDISSCANLLDKQQVKIITERAQLDSGESQDHEVIRLKKQLNEFIEERKGWLEEIDRRQTELVAAQITLEKLREQELFLSTENNVLKRDLTNHKRQVVELEGEMKKLSGQQNLHQRIHHHAKIKEENNMLKIQNEALSAKVLQAEAYLKRVRKGLSNYHQASNRRLIDRVMIEE